MTPCLVIATTDPCIFQLLALSSVLSGSVDGSLKLFHISNKRILGTFVHTSSDVAGQAQDRSMGAEDSMDTDEVPPQGEEVEDEEEEGIISNSIAVECIGFCHTDMPWVASGGMDQHLKIWNLDNGQLRLACAHGAAVVSLVWQRTLPLVTTASLDHIVRVWDARNGNQVISLTGHSQPITNVTSLSFIHGTDATQEISSSKEVEAIVSVADDQTARLFVLDLHKISVA